MSKVWSVAGSSRDIGREFAVPALECREPVAAPLPRIPAR
ncbi:hypothetical protein RKD20_005993 [Streptomyces sp. SLBN-8D4]|jgi:hypothetical protein